MGLVLALVFLFLFLCLELGWSAPHHISYFWQSWGPHTGLLDLLQHLGCFQLLCGQKHL